MWPVKKKTPSQDSLPIDGPWSILEGSDGDSVMIVRANFGYREFGSLPGYEHQVGIAVPVQAPGYSPDEFSELSAIEDALRESLQSQAEALFVAVITTDEMREFVFYTRAPQQMEQKFEQLRNEITSHEIQLMIQPDKTWAVYAELCGGSVAPAPSSN